MAGKSALTLLMIFGFLRNFYVYGTRIMNNFTEIHSVAYITVPDNAVAKQLAHGLVKNKLAACVNIIPQITSVYEWENEINEDSELLLMVKTRTDTVDALTEYVKSHHPYKVCEVITLPIQNGNEQYLKWISEVVPPMDKRKEKDNI
ncbi:protein CutA homolog isoform X1 [Vespa velutina]|uniref:protein CutA homolog isoform X1 n=1 Tax=Vespa velutina TaxID=202808 RepID=UPI001FB23670|nr:protein CutA homolog isoform X1 [Vespa velutina]